MKITKAKNQNRIFIVIACAVSIVIIIFLFIKVDDIRHNGRLYSSKEKMCQDFAKSYLKTVQKTDNLTPTEDKVKWEMAIDVETDLYNLCLVELEKEALKNITLSALEKYSRGVTEMPRDQSISYIVENGDTVPSLATKWRISENTIRWANNLKNDTLKVGTTLSIPPVTGVVHTVKDGETIYTIANKYNADPQDIIGFPFNNINLDDLSLTPGTTLIIPDGVLDE